MKRKSIIVVAAMCFLQGVLIASEQQQSKLTSRAASETGSQRTLASIGSGEWNQNKAIVPLPSADPIIPTTETYQLKVPLNANGVDLLEEETKKLSMHLIKNTLPNGFKLHGIHTYSHSIHHSNGSIETYKKQTIISSRKLPTPTIDTATSPIPLPEAPEMFDSATQTTPVPTVIPESAGTVTPQTLVQPMQPAEGPTQPIIDPVQPPTQDFPGRPDEVMARSFRPISAQTQSRQNSVPSRTRSGKTPMPTSAIIGTCAVVTHRPKSTDSGSLENFAHGSRPASQTSLTRQMGYRAPSVQSKTSSQQTYTTERQQSVTLNYTPSPSQLGKQIPVHSSHEAAMKEFEAHKKANQ